MHLTLLSHLLLLLSTICSHTAIRMAHAQQHQQVSLNGGKLLNVVMKSKKINFAQNDYLKEKEILNAFPAGTNEKVSLIDYNERYGDQGKRNSNHENRAINTVNKLNVATNQAQLNYEDNEHRKSRIIVKQSLDNNSPSKPPPTYANPTLQASSSSSFHPELYPRYIEMFLPHESSPQLHVTKMTTKRFDDDEDWTPIAYVLDPYENWQLRRVGGGGRRRYRISSTTTSTAKPLNRRFYNPIGETIIYGEQIRRNNENSLAAKVAVNQSARNSLVEISVKNNIQLTTQRPGVTANSSRLLNTNHQPGNERIHQRKGKPAQEQFSRSNQTTVAVTKGITTNKPHQTTAKSIEENNAINAEENNTPKKPVKEAEIAAETKVYNNHFNDSSVTMKISPKKMEKNAITKPYETSSSSSVESVSVERPGHWAATVVKNTQQVPFKLNETTWPFSDEAELNVIGEVLLEDATAPSPSSPSSSTSSSSHLTTSTSAPSKSSSYPEISTTSSKLKEFTTTSPSPFEKSESILTSSSNSSLENSTPEPQVCIPMLVREISSENSDEFIEIERIVCFPLQSESEFNLDDVLERATEVIKMKDRVKDTRDKKYSRRNSERKIFNISWVLVLLTVLNSYFL